jgi:hypothetical protein
MNTHVVMIECDEKQHQNYKDESVRLLDIATVINKPLVVLRFNPDDYEDEHGKEHGSCFINESGDRYHVDDKKWNARVEVLAQRFKHHLETVPMNTLTVEHLFYSHPPVVKREMHSISRKLKKVFVVTKSGRRYSCHIKYVEDDSKPTKEANGYCVKVVRRRR